jgi:hypothetical protein
MAMSVVDASNGVNYIFGEGVPIDVEKGIEQLDSVIASKPSIDRIVSTINTGIDKMNPDDYQEIAQRLRIMKAKYPLSTSFVEGIIAKHGFAETACRPDRAAVAEKKAADLRYLGRSDLANVVSPEGRSHPAEMSLPSRVFPHQRLSGGWDPNEDFERIVNGKGLDGKLGGLPTGSSRKPLIR